MNHDLPFCTIRGGLEVHQLAGFLSVLGRLIANRLAEIFSVNRLTSLDNPVNQEHP